jgi:NAD(P)-dependent dehydrogenase (short-subunit alcohol dehydrogenase family)
MPRNNAEKAPDARTYTYPDDLLKGRIILVTGASDGIGQALALEAASLGARVILHGRNSKKLATVYDRIVAEHPESRPAIAVMDLASADCNAYVSVADSVRDTFGRLDGLVHNAGVLGPRLSIEQYDVVEWQRVLHVNLTAAFALTQVLLPLLKLAEDPSIVFTTSGVGRRGRAYWGAYSVSKFATEALAQILADETRHTPLRVNCVNPGATRTRMRLEAYPAEDRDKLKTPEEVLAPYVFLLGPDSRGVTGQSLDAQ